MLAESGFFDRAPRRYYVRLVGTVAAMVAFAALASQRAGSLAGAIAAVLVGIAWGQLGFYGHDAVHGAVARGRRRNALVGHVCLSVFNGLGFQYWRRIHVAHHRHLQSEELDPDLDFPTLLSMTPRAARAKTTFWRRVGRWQAWYFWPLTTLYAHRLRWQGLARMLRAPSRYRIDLVLVPLHFIVWLIVPSLLWTPTVALTTYVIASASAGIYLGAVFAINHIGMHAIASDEQVDLFARHFRCTRNIGNPAALDFLFGGLNFHTAHHLFPRVPHTCLRRGRDALNRFAKSRELTYHEVTLPAAIVSVSRHLAAVAQVLH